MTNNPLEDSLRTERNEIWSRCAEASKTFSEPAQDVCLKWSHAADSLLTKAFLQTFQNQKCALFALGKLGSEELNLSSDVDLLILSADEQVSWTGPLRKLQGLLGDRTAQGFVFRLDFDLRPGGRHGPLVPTVEHFKDYYGNYGETWERLALVRLRPICGDSGIISEALAFAKKFSFRRHLDFTLFEDLKGLRSKIQSHYWDRTQKDVIDLKLGLGGIRDVELFVHALQVVHGGKDPSLQVHSTTEALNLLEKKSLLPTEEVRFLLNHYWNLRGLENYVQSLNDEQTHLLRLKDNHPSQVTTKIKTLSAEMHRCQDIVKSLLGDAPQEISLEKDLKSFGVDDQILQEHWEEILGQEVLSRNKGRDETARKAFLHEFIHSLHQQGGDLNRGLLLLKDFIRATRAKATFFSLLVREKDLLKKISWLFGHSPYLARILCNRPELLDSFVYRSQDRHSEDISLLLEELAEKRLLSELINGSEFLEDKDLSRLLGNLTSTADSICETLLQALQKEFPSKMQILALGKWGGQELGFRSDLDFIFITPDEANDNDYKVAKRMISRLTEAHRGGNIYSIDMRLRPSGKAGPLVLPLNEFQEYLKNEATPWERQAYLKARWLGNAPWSASSFYINKGLSSEELQELNRIRLELLYKGSSLDLKYSEGGLVDIEFAAQVHLLERKLTPKGSSTFDFLSQMGPLAGTLKQNYAVLRQYEQMLQLVASESLTEVDQNHESFQFLALALHKTPKDLFEEIRELLSTNADSLKNLDPRRGPH
ncbi:Glutamate-ammonia-ligase adenylyltransferase [compost metagenome]